MFKAQKGVEITFVIHLAIWGSCDVIRSLTKSASFMRALVIVYTTRISTYDCNLYSHPPFLTLILVPVRLTPHWKL